METEHVSADRGRGFRGGTSGVVSTVSPDAGVRSAAFAAAGTGPAASGKDSVGAVRIARSISRRALAVSARRLPAAPSGPCSAAA